MLILFKNLYKKSGVYFTGIIKGNFTRTPSGKDLPEFLWLQDTLSKKKKLTLQQLFSIMNITELIPEVKNIKFRAMGNGTIEFSHKTNCRVLLESSTVNRGQKAKVRYNDTIYMFFEDDRSELQLQYLPNKPIKNNDKRVSVKLNVF